MTAVAPLLAACGAGSRVEQVLPAGLDLPRDGLAADGERLVVLAEGPGGACPAPALVRRQADGWRSVALPSAASPPCPTTSASTARDGATLAVHDGGDEVRVWRVAADRLEPDGAFRLAAGPGFPFPPPGPNLALGGDGRLLLAGALNRACRRSAGRLRCGVAELAVREPSGWRGVEVLRPPGEAAAEVRFGQAVALAADGRLALVGGTGQPGRSGALWVFALGDGPARVVGVLRPDRDDPGFGTGLSLAADGNRLAVGGSQAVYLFEDAGAGFVLRRRLRPPDASAGYFGEAVALSADGQALLVGAPRARCEAGERCGRAYLYRRGEAWRLVGAVEPAAPAAEATFARRVALDGAGARAAVQGAALHVLDLP